MDFNSNNSTKYVQTSRQKKSTLIKYHKISVFEKNPHKNYDCENKY